MDKEFQQYKLEDFLNDPDFCGWARSERPDLNDHYRDLLQKFPGQNNTLQKAFRLINLFEDEKHNTDQVRKIQIWEKANNVYHRQKKADRIRMVFRYAAVFAAFITIASLAWFIVSTNDQNDFFSSYDVQDYTQTHLLLDNGKELKINTENSEIVYPGKGKPLQVDNKIVLKGKAKNKDAKNLLIVPYGKQSKIILSDRTEVWLNSGSRLIYPSSFGGSERKVLLQGEAYFKVAKNKAKPFIVETKNSKIKVLGTRFNVKAYPDEKDEETVLVEGSIKLDIGKSLFSKNLMVKPGQRVLVGKNSEKYSISNVSADNYTSWTKGIFIFEDEPISLVLMRVSRFYNLKIKLDTKAEDKKISGKLDLKKDYQRVLSTLELISDGNYTLKNGIITYKLNKK